MNRRETLKLIFILYKTERTAGEIDKNSLASFNFRLIEKTNRKEQKAKHLAKNSMQLREMIHLQGK